MPRSVMPTRALAAVPVPQTYAELRRAVELTLVKGQQAVEQARVRTYWDTGRLIHEHVLRFKDRADYGAGTIARLSADMELHRSTLQRCVQFYLAIPNCAPWRNLTWAHYPKFRSSKNQMTGWRLVARFTPRFSALHSRFRAGPSAGAGRGGRAAGPFPGRAWRQRAGATRWSARRV